MNFLIDQNFLHTPKGRRFEALFGLTGKGILLSLLQTLADTKDGYLPVADLNILSETLGADESLFGDVIVALIDAGQLRYEQMCNSIFNPLITTSKSVKDNQRKLLEKNKKAGQDRREIESSEQIENSSAQTEKTSAATTLSLDNIIRKYLEKYNNKKLYLDLVFLSDDEFESVEKRFAKDGLTKRDVQRAIELLNNWWLNNVKLRLSRPCDYRALTAWPLNEVLKENRSKQALDNQKALAAKYGNAPKSEAAPLPPRGFDVAKGHEH